MKAVLLPITDPKVGKRFEKYLSIPPNPKPITEEEEKEIIAFVHRVDLQNDKNDKK